MQREDILNYTIILHEFDTLIQDAGNVGEMSRINVILESSLPYECIKSILEAKFGYCIRYIEGNLPEFCLKDVYLDILDDERKVSVLPYVLDQMIYNYRWLYFISALLDRGRFELLSQLKFAKISDYYFMELMSIAVPEAVVMVATRSLEKNEPTMPLLSLLALAGFGPRVASSPEICRVPLFIVRYLHGKEAPIPKSFVFIDGLDKSSIPFWMYMLKKEPGEATKLLNLVLKHGDYKTQHLANAFRKTVSSSALEGPELDVYRAILSRFRFSSIRNEHVVSNYETMLEELKDIGYHTTCAFLDWGQSQQISQYSFDCSPEAKLGLLVERIHRLQDKSLYPLIQKRVEHLCVAPKLLKGLIQVSADALYIQAVWDSIQNAPRFRLTEDHCCSAPVEALARLASGCNVTIKRVRGMFGMLNGFQGSATRFPKEAHVLYTVVFWQAPEEIIEHFLDQVPSDCKISQQVFLKLLRSVKYSTEFWRRLFWRFVPLDDSMRKEVEKFRPDLMQELSV